MMIDFESRISHRVLRNYGWTKTRGNGERINAILLTKGHVVDATNDLTKNY